MCGRYAIATSRLPRIENALGIALPTLVPRYNVAPTQTVPVVRATADHRYELAEARWGLIPAWSKEPRTTYATFNARVETVATKPAFRAAYRARRCLVPTSGTLDTNWLSKTPTPRMLPGCVRSRSRRSIDC